MTMPDRRPDPRALLPLKAVDFHILLVLTEQDLHGYGMVKEIEKRSDGRIRLEPGNLYRYVKGLVDDGLVEPADRREVGHRRSDEPARRRRYYRITPLGRLVLQEEAARMHGLAAAARQGLGVAEKRS
jgi:DNA-binding PadR family transcriptional regulator